MKLTTPVLVVATLVASANSPHAAVITSPTDPLLRNAGLLDFSFEVPTEAENPNFGGVAFRGVGKSVFAYGSPGGGYLYNAQIVIGHFSSGSNIEILFANPTQAFGSLFTFINYDVTLEAFNDAVSLGATTFNPGDPYEWVFRGFGFDAPIITKALVSIKSSDLIWLDDFYMLVPEPSAALVGASALLPLLVRRRHRRLSPALQ